MSERMTPERLEQIDADATLLAFDPAILGEAKRTVVQSCADRQKELIAEIRACWAEREKASKFILWINSARTEWIEVLRDFESPAPDDQIWFAFHKFDLRSPKTALGNGGTFAQAMKEAMGALAEREAML